MTNQVIPDAAVEAAMWAVPAGASIDRSDVRTLLEAAAPHMFAEVSALVWGEAMTRAAEIAWEHDGSASSALKTTPNPYRADSMTPCAVTPRP